MRGARDRLRAAGALLVLGALGLAGRPGGAQVDDTVPVVVDGGADARAVLLLPLVTAAVAVPADVSVGAASGAITSSPKAQGYAAVVGSDVVEFVGVAANLEGQFADASGLPWPGYPTWCYSYFPTGPGQYGKASCGAPVLSGGTGSVQAAGGTARTSSSGSFEDVRELESTSSARVYDVSVPDFAQVAETSSDGSSFFDEEADATVTKARTVLDDVAIGGDAVRIERLVIELQALAGGQPGTAKTSARVQVEGASTSGYAVVFGPDGVRVNESKLASGESMTAAQESVNETLAAAGVNVRAAGHPEHKQSESGDHAEVVARGLFVDAFPPRPEPPAGAPQPGGTIAYTMTLGAARVSADLRLAVASDGSGTEPLAVPFGPAGAGTTPPAAGGAAGAGLAPTAPTGPLSGPSTGGRVDSGGRAGSGSAEVAGPATAPTAFTEALPARVASELTQVYGAFVAFAALAVALTRLRRPLAFGLKTDRRPFGEVA